MKPSASALDDNRRPVAAQTSSACAESATQCSLDYEGGPGMGGSGPFGETSGGATPIAVENFHMLKQRQTTDTFVDPGDPRRRNLLNWDGKGAGKDLFPPRPGEERPTG